MEDAVYKDILELKKALDSGIHNRKNLYGIEDGGEFQIEEYIEATNENRCLFKDYDMERAICDLLGIKVEYP